jgi:hypothetical protein
LTQKTNPLLESLSMLIGEWLVEVKFPTNPSGTFLGRMSFGWREDGAFLVMHTEPDNKVAPASTFIIGRDDPDADFTALYFDVPGVSRIYKMSLMGNVWRIWRNSQGFSQRFEGKISEKGNVISAHWDKSVDGINWQRDFNLTYTRTK